MNFTIESINFQRRNVTHCLRHQQIVKQAAASFRRIVFGDSVD